LLPETLSRIGQEVSGWRPRPIAMWVFGSAARGDGAVESDIDLLAVLPDDADMDELADRLDDLREHVVAWSGNPAELLVLTASELAERVAENDPLIAELRRDAQVLFGRRPSQLLRQSSR
jgi:predicted nucleotidyltransferase